MKADDGVMDAERQSSGGWRRPSLFRERHRNRGGQQNGLDQSRLVPLPDDGRLSVPQWEEGEEKKMSLIRLSLPSIRCVNLSLVFLLHTAGRRQVTKAFESSQEEAKLAGRDFQG